MADYISRDDVKNALLNKGQHTTRYRLGETWELNFMEILEALDAIPAADVQPVKYGRWEYSEKEYGECAWYFCSFCDEPAEQLYNDEPLLSEFCPHCGARMGGESK